MTSQPLVSVIINTDARLDSLKRTLDSLRWLDYASFEVCIVYGPTADGTKEFLQQRKAEIKIAHCPVRNLSQSRNIGIAMAAGEIVAFLDDDAIPEPEWLTEIVVAFEECDVGGCGGFLHDSTGISYQWRFGTVDRLGVADESWQRPPLECSFPYTKNFAHLMGANSAFRRSALVAVGGFDEQYEYYLDESDLICRLVDHGWRIAPIAGAVVHHKFLPSHFRDKGVFKGWLQLVKSKIYFSLVNSHGHHGVSHALKSVLEFIDRFRTNLEWGIAEGRADEVDRSRFADEVDRGLREGLEAGLARARRFAEWEALKHHAEPFQPFSIILPASDRKMVCLLSKTYPPGPIGGIGRHIHQLGRAMARLGHQVHVLTRGGEQDSVDFESGVWVHRIRPKPQPATRIQGILVPADIWNHSATMLAEVCRIAESRKVDAVIAPIWDCEGISFLEHGGFTLVTGLYTTFQQWLQTTGNRAYDASFMESFIRPMLALEKLLFERSAGMLADSRSIIRDIEGAYSVRFDAAKLGLVLLGLEDWSGEPVTNPEPLPGAVRVLFVGRLEARKGIDILLQAAKAVLPSHPEVHLDVVGDDKLLGPSNLTYRAIFEADRDADSIRDRVHFHGDVSESALRGFYRSCDLFVAPSRFESFGLILLEAMMFGKPVIGCRAGGMTEIVTHEVSGLLAEPGNVESLADCLRRLLNDSQLRAQLGDAGRRRYLASFTAETMALSTLEFVDQLSRKTNNAGVGADARGFSQVPAERAVTVPERPHPRRRIALITSILVRNDAVSAAVRDMYFMLASDPSLEVCLFAARNDFPELPCRNVADSAQLLLEPTYLRADLLIWHFAICYDFFDAILLGNGSARQVVVFHNITPKEHVAESMRSLIERSLCQCHNMRHADEMWSVSEVNAQVASTFGVSKRNCHVIPLCVETPSLGALSVKDSAHFDMLFVGRFVKSKGVLDLLDAIARLPRQNLPPFRLVLAGNMQLSDPLYVEAAKQRIIALDLSQQAHLMGTVDTPTLSQLYHRAHMLVIPSYHEGFCKPVIEGLRAGCIPVGYVSANLPQIAAGLGRMVPAGNIDALAGALAELLFTLPQALRHSAQQSLTLDRGRLSVAEFDVASRDYVGRYTREPVRRQISERVHALLEVDRRMSTGAPTKAHAHV